MADPGTMNVLRARNHSKLRDITTQLESELGIQLEPVRVHRKQHPELYSIHEIGAIADFMGKVLKSIQQLKVTNAKRKTSDGGGDTEVDPRNAGERIDGPSGGPTEEEGPTSSQQSGSVGTGGSTGRGGSRARSSK